MTEIPSARDLMTKSVLTIPAESGIDEAVRIMLKRSYAGVPVVDGEGVVQGVLSEHDCIRVLAQAVADGWPPGRVADHMTRDVETVPPSEDVLALAMRFARGGHRRLLVVEEGRLVGIVSRRDLLRALEALAQEIGGAPRSSTYEVLEERHRKLD